MKSMITNKYQNPSDLLTQMKADEQTQALPQQDSTTVKEARLKAHQAKLAAESPEALLARYGVKPGDAKGLIMQIASMLSPADSTLSPEATAQATADEFRSTPQRYPTAPKK